MPKATTRRPTNRTMSPMVAERATVLITVKASPEIGRTHGETVCVAGIRLDGDDYRWIRLFPVQWQWFWQGEHPKYQVIELEIDKHDKDQRPESYRPRLDTTAVLDQLPAGKRRAEVLNRLPQYRMCDLVARRVGRVPSLGLVVPREITGFTREDHTGDTAHAAKMNRAAQGSLLAQGAPKLEFSPFTFKLPTAANRPRASATNRASSTGRSPRRGGTGGAVTRPTTSIGSKRSGSAWSTQRACRHCTWATSTRHRKVSSCSASPAMSRRSNRRQWVPVQKTLRHDRAMARARIRPRRTEGRLFDL